MNKFSPIIKWLDRGSNLESLLSPHTAIPELERGGFLTLDRAIPLHESVYKSAESLSESWRLSSQYVNDCKEILSIDELGYLDKYEIALIKEQLGEPPAVAYPIYLISVIEKNAQERIVYVGKTSSKSRRFKGGHTAITKLHAPQYDGLEKRLYLACVVLLTRDRYLPLEWVHPLDRAEEILSSIETQLIYSFQPELNTQNKDKDNTKEYVQLHIQNFENESGFLHDKFC